MRGIPPVLEIDSEDVAWALQTADALWLRNERVDALVWLRRAAQAAGDSGDDARAVQLARAAADLSDWMSQSSGLPPSEPANVHDSIEELLSVSRQDEPRSPAPTAAQTRAGMLHPWSDEETRDHPQAEIRDNSRPLVDDQEELTETVTAIGERLNKSVLPVGPNEIFDDDVITSAKGQVIRPPVGSLAMPPPPRILPPQIEPPRVAAPPPRPPPPPIPRPRVDAEMLSETDLVSVPPSPLSDSQTIHLPGRTARAAPQPGDVDDSVTTRISREQAESLSGVDESNDSLIGHVVSLEESIETFVSARPDLRDLAEEYAAEAQARARRSEEETQAFDIPPDVAPLREGGTVADEVSPQVNESGTLATTSSVRIAYPVDSSEDLSDLAADPAFLDVVPSMPERATDRPVATHQERGGKEVVELDHVDALSDIPDEEREAFAATAKFHELERDDEIASFALALVISGDVDVVATVLDATEPITAGTVLRSRGTNEKGFELRLVCRSEKARVATWKTEPVEAAFKSCPWVEDDLRIATDRLQALVGITSGPLADRMDAALRQEVVGRMTTRALAPHEVLLKKGDTVPGLYVVGVGGLDLLDGDTVTGSVVVGDFVFPDQVLGTGPAPATVRAPTEGAVVLYADRKAAQELLVTCPPLLEILAGM